MNQPDVIMTSRYCDDNGCFASVDLTDNMLLLKIFDVALASVSVCLLAAACAARNLPELRQMYSSTARSERAVRAASQHSDWPQTSVDTSTRTRSARRHLHVRSTTALKHRSKRAAIVNGFTSWDYEPLELGAFRTRRG